MVADRPSEFVFDVTAGAGSGTEVGDETGVDFDLGFEGGEKTEAPSGLDFDLGSDEGEGEAGGLDFDLGDLGVQPEEPEAGAAAKRESSDTGLDFDLAAGAAPGEESGGTGLDFDLGDLGETQAGETQTDKTAPLAPGGSIPERVGGADEEMDFDLTGLDDGSQTLDAERGGEGAQSLDFEAARGAEERTARQDEVGEESGLDFDLSDTMTMDSDALERVKAEDDLPEEPPESGGEDSGLDFDLSDTTVFGGGADAAQGDATEVAADSDLDFDLGDLGDEDKAPAAGAAEAPEDTGAELDFDLGDTATLEGAGAAGETGEKAPPDEESELDFDLGDTGAGAPSIDEGAAAGEESLDFDLGDTGGTPAGGEEEEPLDLSLDAGASGDEELTSLSDPFGDSGSGDELLSLDMELGAGGEEGERSAGEDLSLDMDADDLRIDQDAATEVLEDAFEDARTEVGSGSGLDLSLDGGDGTTRGGGGTSEDDGPGTVQLSPDDADAVRPPGLPGDEGGEGFGVDTEFRGIFDGGGASDAGDASSLDFDLGTDLDEQPSGEGGSDMEDTQFMLRDAPGADIPGSDDDDEDHTLVLGRGASGEVDEMQTKLDLAQAYMDMGDTEGARNLLGEVMAEGGEAQQDQAREMLGKLS